MQPDTIQPGMSDLREYLAILRKRKWSIFLVTLIVVGTAAGLTVRQTPVYTSDARVLVLPTAPATSQFYFLATINMDTEAGLVDSESVAILVRDNLGLNQSVQELLSGLDVGVEGATEILDIGYTDPSPARAQRLAQAFADAYLQFRESQAQTQIQGQIDDLERQSEKVSGEITALQPQIDAAQSTTKRTSLQNEQEGLRARLQVLQQDLADLGSGTAIQPGGEVVQPSYRPRSPSNSGVVRNGILGVFVGLALGVGLAFIRERMDDSLRGRDDLERYLGAPILAVVPHVNSWRRKKDAMLVTVAEPHAAAAEAYRTMRTGVLFAASRHDLKVLMVTSPSDGEGKTATAANLAVVLAQAEKKVVLVSADLRRPRIHRFFQVDNERGLVDVLIGDLPLEDALEATGVPGLGLLPVGPIPANPTELLQSEAMAATLSRLRGSFDFVIIDSAPALAVADPLTLAPIVDGVLFVADAGSTDRHGVLRTRAQLEQVGATLVGGVLNNFDPTSARGGYYYRYYYGYGHASQSTDGKPRADDGSDSGLGREQVRE